MYNQFFSKGGIKYIYHIRCICLDYHMMRVNRQNPQQLFYNKTFTPPVGFLIGRDTQTREDKVFVQYSVRVIFNAFHNE